MAKHLPGKVARIISDFLTIGELTKLIEHEMEKRVVARHGLVKLDALLNLVARLKNEFRDTLPPGQKKMSSYWRGTSSASARTSKIATWKRVVMLWWRTPCTWT